LRKNTLLKKALRKNVFVYFSITQF